MIERKKRCSRGDEWENISVRSSIVMASCSLTGPLKAQVLLSLLFVPFFFFKRSTLPVTSLALIPGGFQGIWEVLRVWPGAFA